MSLTITITTDKKGRITGLLVPNGAVAQVVTDCESTDAFAARYGAPDEVYYRYDADDDYGHLPHVPRGFRARQHMTLHSLDGKVIA